MALTRRPQGQKKTKEYESIGRAMESIFESGYVNHRRVYTVNFIRGLFFGLGSVIGGTVVVALFVWILSLFGELPLINDLVKTIEQSVD
jgi:hypothetical protein